MVAFGHDAADLRRRAADLRERWNDVMWDRRGWFALGVDGDGRTDRLADDQPRPCAVERHRRARSWPTATSIACANQSCGRDGAFVPWPRRWAPTTRSATTTARCGHTTRRLRGRRRAVRPLGRRRHDRRRSARRGRPLRRATTGAVRRDLARRRCRCRSAIPASCSPQAWSSASVLLLVRVMLGLEPAPTGVELRRREFASIPTLTVSDFAPAAAVSTSAWPTVPLRSAWRMRGARCSAASCRRADAAFVVGGAAV